MKSTKTNAEEFLQQPKGVNKSWFRTMMVFLIAIIGFGILLGLDVNYAGFLGTALESGNKTDFISNLSNNQPLTYAVGVISILAFCLIVLPFVCWFSLWMIGINQVSRSPFFHIFMWLIAALLMVLLLICIVMFIRASVFNLNDVAPPQTEAPSEGTTRSLLNNIYEAIRY